MTPKNETSNLFGEINVARLLKILLKRCWIIILAAAIGGVGTFLYSTYKITPLYKANTLIFINNNKNYTIDTQNNRITSADISSAQSLVDTYTVILKTRSTLEDVIKRADLKYSYSQLSGMVSASASEGSPVLNISVLSPKPEDSALIANTIAEVLPEKISSVIDGSSVRVVDYAIVPTYSSSPNIPSNTTKGVLIGGVLAAALIAFFALLDKKIHDEEFLTQTFEVPILGVIPQINRERAGRKGYYKYKGYYKRYYRGYY